MNIYKNCSLAIIQDFYAGQRISLESSLTLDNYISMSKMFIALKSILKGFNALPCSAHYFMLWMNHQNISKCYCVFMY